MSAADDYRRLLRRLAALDAEAAADRVEAHDWYAARDADVEQAVSAARAEVAAAQNDVYAAQRDRDAVDARAAGLWTDFVHRVGPVAERFGRTVPPPTVPRQRDGRTADAYLEEAAGRLAYTPPARPLTGGTTVLFGLLGAAGGAVGVTAQRLLVAAGRAAGGDWAAGLPVLGLIVMLVGPVLAVVAAKRIADRRGVGLDATSVATVLVAGVLTAGLLYVLAPTGD